MPPLASFLLATGAFLIAVRPVTAQDSSRSPASIIRTVPDARLSVAMEPPLSLDGGTHPGALAALGDSAYANYGLEGALIGGLTTGLALTFFFCASLEDADCGLPAFLLGTAVLGLPGFVIGGLIGAGIKKDRGEADARRASVTALPTWFDGGAPETSQILPAARPGS